MLTPIRSAVAMTIQPRTVAVSHPPHGKPTDDLSIVYPSSDGEPMAASDLQYVPLTETVFYFARPLH